MEDPTGITAFRKVIDENRAKREQAEAASRDAEVQNKPEEKPAEQVEVEKPAEERAEEKPAEQSASENTESAVAA